MRAWRARFGARFACQNRRKDVGRRFPEKLAGSLKHVRVQHNTAVQTLVEAAAGDERDPVVKSRRRTIFGFRRRAIEQSGATPPEPGKRMRTFLRRTDAIKVEKAKQFVWTGCHGQPQLRRKVKTQQQRIRNAVIKNMQRLGHELPLRHRGASVRSAGGVQQ